MITHLEPDILECEVKWLLESITMNKANGGPILKLKLQYFGHLLRRADSLEKTLMLGKTEGKRRRGSSG